MNLKDKAFLDKFCVNYRVVSTPPPPSPPYQSKNDQISTQGISIRIERFPDQTPLDARPGLWIQPSYEAPADLQLKIVRKHSEINIRVVLRIAQSWFWDRQIAVDFLQLLFGCPTTIFGRFSRGQPYSPLLRFSDHNSRIKFLPNMFLQKVKRSLTLSCWSKKSIYIRVDKTFFI